MNRVYCVFCYSNYSDEKLTAQEILTSDLRDKAFVVGTSADARSKAYKMAESRVSRATRFSDNKLSYVYGYFSVELGDMRQERATLIKKFERGDAML